MSPRLLLPLLLLAATLITAQAQGEGHKTLLPACGWDGAGDVGARQGPCRVPGGVMAARSGGLWCICICAMLRVGGLQGSCVPGGVFVHACVCTRPVGVCHWLAVLAWLGGVCVCARGWWGSSTTS